jgi:hypothetical protein
MRAIADRRPTTNGAIRASLYCLGCAAAPFPHRQGHYGRWVAQDQQGLCGGLFVDHAEALKFAMFENRNCPQAVIVVSGVLELNMSGTPRAVSAS